jgi:Flp pilus assembly protein TadG
VIRHPAQQRTGAVVPLLAFLLVFLIAMVAFAVDIGYIAVVQKELQTAADSAALAGASQLVNRAALQGSVSQSTLASNARDQAQRLSALNTGGGVSLTLDRNDPNDSGGDIVVGSITNPSNPSSQLTTTTPYDSVQVRVRRTAQKNGALQLFFGPVLGHATQDITATATATYQGRVINGFKVTGSGKTTSLLLPFTLDIAVWTDQVINGNGPDNWTYNPTTQAYAAGSDGIHEVNLYPTKGNSPGNFGTVNIGQPNNGTPELERQILYGPNASDLVAMGGQIALGADGTLTLQGNPGISAGFKDDLASIRGQPRIIPLYSKVTGQGNNTYYTIVAFAGIIITDVQLTGNNKHVTIQPEMAVDPTAITGASTSTTSFFVYQPLQLCR